MEHASTCQRSSMCYSSATGAWSMEKICYFMKCRSGRLPPLSFKNHHSLDTTVEYGRYLAESVSSCRGCHTERNMSTGEYIGEELAGGPALEIPGEPRRMLMSANLTPDPKTGVLYDWTFDKFKTRFQQGRIVKETIMPWGQFKQMNDTELLALWKYLHSVKPVHRDNGAYVQVIKK